MLSPKVSCIIKDLAATFISLSEKEVVVIDIADSVHHERLLSMVKRVLDDVLAIIVLVDVISGLFLYSSFLHDFLICCFPGYLHISTHIAQL